MKRPAHGEPIKAASIPAAKNIQLSSISLLTYPSWLDTLRTTKEIDMPTVYAIHAPEAEKLETVKSEMEAMGAPTIRVIDCGDYYMAMEGSHRLAAAHELGIDPELVIYEQEDEIDISGFDWFDSANWAETVYPAGEVAGELFSPQQATPYRF
jgi:hypothetical protein